LKALDTPITGEKIRDVLVESLTECGAIKNGEPQTKIWGMSDEGSNFQKAMQLLKNAEIIEGSIPCFNHKIQNAIKDARSSTPGMNNP
jgi:hypothetical protein